MAGDVARFCHQRSHKPSLLPAFLSEVRVTVLLNLYQCYTVNFMRLYF